MSDLIHLLPDFVANQIAAGEVVNRPSAAVKELLENAIDAGATQIELIIQEAGRTLIQIIDNGCGMSPADASKCFLRHATSKIKEAHDLYAIRTMGFRGEALASIAAIAKIELKTRLANEELGYCVTLEGSEIKEESPCQCNAGTSIAVKHLYYNTPARRQFLKNNETEFHYIEEDFFKIALANPGIKFIFYKDDKKIYNLEPSHLNHRIVQLMGSIFQSRLVKVDESLTEISIAGYICKPDYSTKNRNKQYLFVNGRYIKHLGLNHAIETAFKDLLPQKSYPVYFLFLEVDPKSIDINIHPTKTEIRFADEKMIYGILLSIVKHAIGIHSIPPSIDFDLTNQFAPTPLPDGYIPPPPDLHFNPKYNPFDTPSLESLLSQQNAQPSSVNEKWVKDTNLSANVNSYQNPYGFSKLSNRSKEAYLDNFAEIHSTQNILEPTTTISSQICLPLDTDMQNTQEQAARVFQIQQTYIVASLRSGIVIIDQQAASERILFERFKEKDSHNRILSQRSLFPQTLEFSPSNTEILIDLKEELLILGWDIEGLGQCSFVVNGTPPEVNNEEVGLALEAILDNYKELLMHPHREKKTDVASSVAKQLSIKKGKFLNVEEMLYIIDQLFACVYAEKSPSGKKTFWVLSTDQIAEQFLK
ncbi:MAG: DNA mismatch repair endonuclease MutL [Bacteroidales bacterium]